MVLILSARMGGRNLLFALLGNVGAPFDDVAKICGETPSGKITNEVSDDQRREPALISQSYQRMHKRVTVDGGSTFELN